MLRKNLVVVMLVICTLSFVVFTMTNFNAFAQNNCSAQDNAACAQSDLSLPVPSENEIVPPGVYNNHQKTHRIMKKTLAAKMINLKIMVTMMTEIPSFCHSHDDKNRNVV